MYLRIACLLALSLPLAPLVAHNSPTQIHDSMADAQPCEEQAPWEEELQAIDNELRDLVIQVHNLRRRALHAEVQSQPFMGSEAGSHEVEEKGREAEGDKNQATLLENKIRDLLRKRQELLQSNISPEDSAP